MDLRRVRFWDWVAGIAGAVLIGSMFLHWYSVPVRGRALGGVRLSVNAWQAFSVVDVFVLIAALFGIAILIVTATQRTASLAQSVSSSSVIPVVVAAVMVVVRAVDPPSMQSIVDGTWFRTSRSGFSIVFFTGHGSVSRDAGLWIGLGAILTLLVACWRAMRDQSFPSPVRSRVEVTRMPAPRSDPQ